MITKLYEFLELDKSYDYEDITDDNGRFYTFGQLEYTFKADDDETYWVHLMTHKESNTISNICWANYKDSIKTSYIDEKTSKTININTLFKIINTVFKIVFDVMKKYEIGEATIGSRNKSKYRVYKQAIEEEKDFKIITEWRGTSTYWMNFEYLKKNDS